MTNRPNPSLFVLTIPNSSDRQQVVQELIRADNTEYGNPLTPLGNRRFVLSRPIAKKLLSRHPNLQEWLTNLHGVSLARRLRADQVMALYGSLDPADPTYAPSTVDKNISSLPWHYTSIRVPQAWKYLESKNPSGISQVSIALFDTGITRHPCFGDWNDGQNKHIRTDLGINYLESGSIPLDPIETQYTGHSGHGTRVGSVIAANSSQFVGVARGVTLVPYRVTNSVIIDFMGNKTPLSDAFNHARNHSGCQVVNISLGDPCFPDSEDGKALDDAYEAGTIVVAAAGNVTSEVTYPGRYRRTIAAGGVTKYRSSWKPWSGGSRGPRVDFCAPSDRITRANWKKTEKWHPVYQYDGDGTSYAAAHISGLACLWIALWQRELLNYPHPWQIVEAFRKVVGDSCHKPRDWDERRFGRGIINAEATLKASLPKSEELKYESDRAEDDWI